MSSTIVAGLVLPVALGGHPGLDFCNTRAGWCSAAPREYLPTYRHLAIWAGYAGLLQPATLDRLVRHARPEPKAEHRVLADSLELRDAAYAVLLGSRSAAAFAIVRRHALAARAAGVLRRTTAPPGPVARWALAPEGTDAPLLAVAAALDDLLCSPLSGVVAACPGDGCGWLFADQRRRRRWCDMAVCGNRAKARRHADRQAARSL